MKAQLQDKLDVAKLRSESQQIVLAQKATEALDQVNDPTSFLSVINDPSYTTLQTFEPYKAYVAIKAQAMLNHTTDPIQQAQLLRTMEAAKPGSSKAQLPGLPQETQRLFLDPKELAEMELKQAQAAKVNQEVADAKAAATAQAAMAAKVPVDPLEQSLRESGALATLGNEGAPQPGAVQPGTPSTVGAQAKPTPTPPGSESSTTTAAEAPTVGPDGKPLRKVIVGTDIFLTDKPAPTTLKEAQAEQVKFIKERMREQDKSRVWLDQWLGDPGTPSDKLADQVLLETMQQNPGKSITELTPFIKLKMEALTLKPEEYKDKTEFSGNVQALDITTQKLEAAMATIDAYVAKGGSPSLGPDATMGQWFDWAIGHAGSEEAAELVNARKILASEGFLAALQNLSTMQLGRISDMSNTPVEKAGIAATSTGEGISIESNKQAIEIMKAKTQQGKDLLSIVNAFGKARHSYNAATSAAEAYFRSNPYLEVDQINGVPSVKVKKNRLKVEDYIKDSLHLDKYTARMPDGRAASSKVVDPISLATDLAEQVKKGTATLANSSDIPDNMKQANPALANRTAFRESSFNPDAVGPVTRTGERAEGLFQLMPATGNEEWDELKKKSWKELNFSGDYDPKDVTKNAIIGVKYLNKQLVNYNGDVRLALAAYNYGPGNTNKMLAAVDAAEKGMGRTTWDAVQHYLPKETQDYVSFIMGDEETVRQERKTVLPEELPTVYASLKSSKAQSYAQEKLTPEGLSALRDTNEIKTVADTKGTILEDAVGALFALNPFSATTAEAQEPEEETGSSDSNTRVLNDDGSVSEEAGGTYPDPETGMPITMPSLEDDESGRRIFEELNPFRGAETAEADTGMQVSPWDNTGARSPAPKTVTTPQSREEALSTASDFSDGMQAAVLGAARGLLFGGEDEAFALLRMQAHGETWEQATAQTRAIRDALQEAHPWAYNIGNAAGGLLSPIPGTIFKAGGAIFRGAKTAFGIGKTAQSGNAIAQATKVAESAKAASVPSLGKTIGQGAGVGAAAGGITGWLEGEMGNDGSSEWENRMGRGLQGTVFGGLLGAGLGGFLYKVAKGSTNYTPQERSILKNMIGKSDTELQSDIDHLIKSNNPAGSWLAKQGIKKVKGYIDDIAKNPNTLADVIDLSEDRLAGQAGRVAALLGQKRGSSDAAADLGQVISKKVDDFYSERRAVADSVYADAEKVASKNSIQNQAKFAKYRFAYPVQNESVMYGGAIPKGTTAERHDAMVDTALSKRQLNREEMTPAPSSAVYGVTEKQNPMPEGIGGPSILDKQKLPTEAPYNVYGVPESKVRRFRQPRIGKLEDRPAFTSDDVANAIEDPHVEKFIKQVKPEVDPRNQLEVNDFDVLQAANSALGKAAKNGDHLAAKAHEKLQKAMYKENDAYRIADEAYKKSTATLEAKYSKGVEKLEKYSVPGATTNIRDIHQDLMDLGPDEIKAIMKEMNPTEQEAVKNSVRAYITDTLKSRSPRLKGEKTREFPELLKDFGDEKIRAVFDPKEAEKYISGLQEEGQITALANKFINSGQAAAKAAAEKGEKLESRVAQDVTGFAGAVGMVGIWGANRYTTSIAGITLLKAMHAWVRSKKYNNEAELAEGIADIVYRDPKLALELLEKVATNVQKEAPVWAPTWNKAVATAAQMVVSSGNEGEPQTRKREQERTDALYPDQPVEIRIEGPGKRISKEELAKESK